MEIEMDSENESLKRIGKPPPLMSQKKSLTEKVKKYQCLFGKSQKNIQTKRRFSKKISLSKTFALFSCFDYYFFEVLKTKITSCQTLCRPSRFQPSKFCVTIIATITWYEHQ